MDRSKGTTVVFRNMNKRGGVLEFVCYNAGTKKVWNAMGKLSHSSPSITIRSTRGGKCWGCEEQVLKCNFAKTELCAADKDTMA